MTQTVLLVADARSLRPGLMDDGYEVVTATAAEPAVDRAVDSGVDCVVTPLDLPESSGFDLAAAARDRDPLLPVVVVGTVPLSTVADEALAAGVAAYVDREADGDESVVEAVDDAVATARRRRDSARLPRDGPDPGFLLCDGAIREATDGVASLLGVADATGRPLADLAVDRARDDVREAVRDATPDPSSVRFAPANAPDTTVEARLWRTADESIAATLRDVTERADRLAALERRNQRLGEFTEVLTHDIRNPLTIATGYLQLARQDPHEDAFEKCDAALKRIDELIEEVRTSVLEDQSDPDPEPMALEAAAREAWTTVDTGSAELVVEGAMRLRADPGRLRRLFENLFRNAVEHGSTSPDSQARQDAVEHGSTSPPSQSQENAVEHGSAAADRGAGLTVRVVALDDGFAVEDDGVGLPQSGDEDVFERGFTTASAGTGLGLAIVRNVAETHGWEIEAGESDAGGARFVFSQVLRSGESVVEMTAGGEDIWDDTDQGHFYYAERDGDFDVRVEVRSVGNTHAWAKGGLMVRPSLDPETAHVMLRRRPNGTSTLQWRPASSNDARSLTSMAGRPHAAGDAVEPVHDWLRLVREGESIRAYTSETGDDWTLLADLDAADVGLSGPVLLGLAATSHNRAERTTARFANLAGVSPDTAADVGDPILRGDVSAIQPSLVSVHDPADVTPAAATLRGAVESLRASEDLAVRFEYREVTAADWTDVDAGSLSEPSEVSADVDGLSPRRYYEYRVVVDYGDEVERSDPALVGTPGRSPGADRAGPRSSAQFDPADGFADVAPWLDDDTPLVRITEPDRRQLDAAVSVDGPRVVVFETSGTIDLDEFDVTVTGDKCWIAGQTAPSPGITLVRGRLKIAADDCVVQHLRSRPGDAGVDDQFQREGILVDDGAETVVVDHCTAAWSPVESLTVSYRTVDVTVTNCLIAEGLYDARAALGHRGFGTIVGESASNVALLGNVWTHNRGRNPWLQVGTESALVNNVHCDFDEAVVLDGTAVATVEGNVFRRGDGEFAAIAGGQAYLTDNATDPGLQAVEDVTELDERPVWPEGLDPLPSDAVLDHALDHVGARPADRTVHDERVLAQLREGTGGWIDSQTDVGGYPQLPEHSEELAVPERNLRAWLREQARQVEP